MLYKTTMYKSNVDTESELALKKFVDKILIFGKMSRQDHIVLTATVTAHGDIGEVERRQINRIFDRLQTGQLKLVDW
jgi:hypothetical protein